MDHRIGIHQNPDRRRIHAFKRIQIQKQRNDRKQNHDKIKHDIKQWFGRDSARIKREKRQNHHRCNQHLQSQYDKAVKLIVFALADQVKRKRKRNDKAVNQIGYAFKNQDYAA